MGAVKTAAKTAVTRALLANPWLIVVAVGAVAVFLIVIAAFGITIGTVLLAQSASACETPIATTVPTSGAGSGLSAAAGKRVAAAAYNAGWRGNDLVEMTAVAYAESGWNPNVGNGSHEGLWESTTSSFGGQNPHDPTVDAKVALAQWLEHLKPTPAGVLGGPDPSPGPFTGRAPVITVSQTVDGGLPLNVPEEPWQDWPPSAGFGNYKTALGFLNANISRWGLPAGWATQTTKGAVALGGGGAPVSASPTGQCTTMVSYRGYVDPLPGAQLSRIDEGTDYTLGPESFLAPADSRIVYSQVIPSGAPPNFFKGGEISGEILDGPLAGKVWYIAEGIVPAPGIHVGSIVRAGQQITRNAVSEYNGIDGNIEAGWAEPANADPAFPLAQITGGYIECHVTAAGESWNYFATHLGAVRGGEDPGACEDVMGNPAQLTKMGYPPALGPGGVLGG